MKALLDFVSKTRKRRKKLKNKISGREI